MASKKKEVAKTGSNEMVVTDRPSYLGNQERGQENVGTEDVIIPRLEIIQAISPQKKKNDPAYIEGAEDGMLFNTVSRELYGTAIFFIPVYFRKEWIIWKLRKKGGGFNGAFATEALAVAELANLDGPEEDYEVTDTGQHFGLILKPESTAEVPVVETVVISMSKSKMKVSRQLNTMAKMAGGDRFSRLYEIGSAEDQNQAGDDYQNLTVKSLGFVTEAAYHLAEKAYEDVASGNKDVSRESGEGNAAEKAEYEA